MADLDGTDIGDDYEGTDEPVGECDDCGTNIYEENECGLCDQCEWARRASRRPPSSKRTDR